MGIWSTGSDDVGSIKSTKAPNRWRHSDLSQQVRERDEDAVSVQELMHSEMMFST